MIQIAQFFLFNGLGPASRATYEAKLRSYLHFCLSVAKVRPFPASQDILLFYVTDRAKNGVQWSTIRGHLAAIKSAHIDLGLDLDMTQFASLQRMLVGIKRFQGVQPDSRLPITYNILCKMLFHLQPKSNLTKAIFRAAFSLAYFGILRVSEFAAAIPVDQTKLLRHENITLLPDKRHPNLMQLHLKASKTDVFRKGITIPIPCVCANSQICAVHEMQNLLSFQPQATDQSPLFIFPNGDLLNRKTVASMLKALTKKCGLAKGRYKAHSFRKGAASTLAAAGIPDSTIQTMGRWSTDCYKIYINLSQSQISNFAKALCVVGSSP